MLDILFNYDLFILYFVESEENCIKHKDHFLAQKPLLKKDYKNIE